MRRRRCRRGLAQKILFPLAVKLEQQELGCVQYQVANGGGSLLVLG